MGNCLLSKLFVYAMTPCACSVLMKVCYFLKSRAEDIRDAARQTLAKMLGNLGLSYMTTITDNLQSTLVKGTVFLLTCSIGALMRVWRDPLPLLYHDAHCTALFRTPQNYKTTVMIKNLEHFNLLIFYLSSPNRGVLFLSLMGAVTKPPSIALPQTPLSCSAANTHRL